MRTPTNRSNLQGFTLKDTAVTLAIMSSVLCLLVPLFLHGANASDVHARQNARELCSICYQAQCSGVNFVSGSEVGATVQNLLRGGESSSGRAFRAAGITNDEAAAASRYLRVEGGALVVEMNTDS